LEEIATTALRMLRLFGMRIPVVFRWGDEAICVDVTIRRGFAPGSRRPMNDWTTRYRDSLNELDRYRDLVDAVVAVGGHRRPKVDRDASHGLLEGLAHGVRCRVPHLAGRNRSHRSRSVDGVLAHLHQTLFDDLGLGRPEAVSLHPDEMDVELVLGGIPGLPLPCSLIYCAVAERVGLEAFGIDLPGRFFVGVRDETRHRLTMIDPFQNGRIVDGAEFRELAAEIDPGIDPGRFITPASPGIWLRRWLQDLKIVCSRSGEIQHLESWNQLTSTTEEMLERRD